MITSFLSEEESTRRDIQEALRTSGRYYMGSVQESEDKNANMAMDVPIEEDYEQELAEAWDDVDGQELDPETVRALEMEWYMKMNVCEKRPIAECIEKTKKPPIKVRDRQNVNVRSRLVKKKINTCKEEGLFAATPPLEALRMLLTATVTGKHRCGKLIKSMYGTRAAAHDWQAEVTRTMKKLRFNQGKASMCVFWHQQKDNKALVHGDDFVSSGESGTCVAVQGAEDEVRDKEDDAMAKEARVLNRVVRWHPRNGIAYEADTRHADKTISTPATEEAERETEEEKRRDLNGSRLSGKLRSKMDDDDKDDALSVDEVTRYRCRTGKLLGTRQNGHRVRYEGSNETNDGAHYRRLQQTRQAGKILCQILQSRELVQVPECIRGSRSVHRLGLGWMQKNEDVDVRWMHPQRPAHA